MNIEIKFSLTELTVIFKTFPAIFLEQNRTYYADLKDGQQPYSPTASIEEHNSFAANQQ